MPAACTRWPVGSLRSRCGGRAEEVSLRATSLMQSAGNCPERGGRASGRGARPRGCVNRSKSRELHAGVQSCRIAMSTANAGRGVSRRAGSGPELPGGGAGKSGERGIRTLDTVLPVYALSRRAPSTTRPSLQARRPFPRPDGPITYSEASGVARLRDRPRVERLPSRDAHPPLDTCGPDGYLYRLTAGALSSAG